MSAGISPYDFVQQVYYTQEKVILDFWPDDDKYKEVLMEANLVLQELQKEEDWNWLRKEFPLGPTGTTVSQWARAYNISGIGETGEGVLNTYTPANTGDIYKPCTTYGDCIRLYRINSEDNDRANDWDYIKVPFISVGAKDFARYREHNRLSLTNTLDIALKAVYFDGKITFNRPLFGPELNRYAYMDIQKRFTPIHICTPACRTPDNEIPDYNEVVSSTDLTWAKPCSQIVNSDTLALIPIFTEIPDPNYMVYRTAYYHAMGSPSAQGRIADLQDTSQKLLSAMRENNAAFTEPDMFDWNGIGYIDVI